MNCRAMGEGGEEGGGREQWGKKARDNCERNKHCFEDLCFMPFAGFSTLPSGSSGCAREIGRSEVVG